MADVQMKGITCCGDCVYYSMKKHKCTRGYNEEGKATDHFYKDCPLPDVRPVVRGRWVRSEDADDGYCSNCKCDMPMCREDWEWKYCETDFCPNCGAKMEVQHDD